VKISLFVGGGLLLNYSHCRLLKLTDNDEIYDRKCGSQGRIQKLPVGDDGVQGQSPWWGRGLAAKQQTSESILLALLIMLVVNMRKCQWASYTGGECISSSSF